MTKRDRIVPLLVLAALASGCRATFHGDRGGGDPADLAAIEAQHEAARATPTAAAGPSRTELRTEAARVLDDWHEAAAVGDRDRYIGHFAPDAVFLGTDATERWDLASFTAYVDEHFEPGRGWAYTPSDRHVILGPDERIAWFDEALTSSGYGALRGTGVLRRDGATWRIAHYSMAFTVPNEVARDVVEIVRGR